MTQQFTIDLPADLVISSNRQALIWKRKKLKDHCAQTIPYLARKLDPMGKATIHVGVTKRTNGRYDPVNLSDTAKPMVDVLVGMGLLDEDDHRHVMGPWMYHRGTDKRLHGAIRFTLIFTKYSELPF